MPAVRARDVTGRVMHAREHLALALAQAAGHGSNAAAVGGGRTPEQPEGVSVSRRAPLLARRIYVRPGSGRSRPPPCPDGSLVFCSRGVKRNIPFGRYHEPGNKTRPACFAIAFEETAGSRQASYMVDDDVADCRFRF